MRPRRLALFGILALISVAVGRVVAQGGTVFLFQAKLVTPADAGNFGIAVGVSGTTAVIGSQNARDAMGIVRGAAFVFVQNGTTWSPQADLRSSDGAAGDFFGSHVAISNDTIVVGAPRVDIGGLSNRGAAYVFVRSGTTWTEQQKLTAPTGVEFGTAVAIDGNTAVVGSPSETVDGAFARGAVYVFVRSGTVWTLQQRLLAPDGLAQDGFGASVALSGNTVIAGATGDDLGSQSNQGSASVFVRSGTTWSFQQQLFAGDGAANDLFGSSLALSGDRALIGVPAHDPGDVNSQGAAYLFIRVGSVWSLEQKLTASDGAALDRFGERVAIQGLVALVGAPNPQSGRAYVFRKDSSGWIQNETLTPSDLTSVFTVVAIDGPIVVVGAPEFGRVLGPGSAYAFTAQPAGALAPPPPVVSPAIVTGSTVQLNWTTSAGATRYQVRAGTAPGGSNAFDGDVGNTTSVTAVNVATGSYFVRVHAVGSSGESAASNEVRVDVGVAGPCVVSPPANLQFTVAARVVTLTWTGSAGAESYIVEAGSISGAANLASFDTNNAATVFMANAPPGTYFVRVRARRSCGTSAPSNERIIVVN